MEQSNDFQSKIYVTYERARSWVSTFLGIIITVVGMAVIFVVSSLEGTKEIKASNKEATVILEFWRSENASEDFPENRGEIIVYNNEEYYFVLNDGDWYFAYDGGIGFVFSDYKFYVLTLLTIVISTYVSSVNYTTTVRGMRNTEMFKLSLKHYQTQKEKIFAYTQYIPDFCIYKNQQTHEITKRDIVEEANINYAFFKSKDFSLDKIEPWQAKVLKRIERIKVKKIHSSDLLQEQGTSKTTISLLPMSQQEHQRIFTLAGIGQRIIASTLSGLVVAFGVVLGNWFLGLVYGFVVLSSAVSAIVIASDFVQTTLRNRYIAKADLLQEFDNIKHIFIEKKVEEAPAKQEVKIEEEKEEKTVIHLPMIQQSGII
jgi:hypothetical protein